MSWLSSKPLLPGDVKSEHLAALSVVTEKIADLAITTAKIAANAVTSAKIAAGAVIAEKIADAAVTTNKIASSAVSAVKIATSAVTETKLATAAVTAAKIAAGAVTLEKLAAEATPALTKHYKSPDQVITTAGALSLSHGLGVMPKLVTVALVCQEAEWGYSVGDVVIVNPASNQLLNQYRGLSLVLSETKIDVRFGSDSSCFSVIRKDNGGGTWLTNSKWKIRFEALA